MDFYCEICGQRLVHARCCGGEIAPNRNGFTVRLECRSCQRRVTLWLDHSMKELRRRETMTSRSTGRHPGPQHAATLCWKCQHSVGGPNGCSWFKDFTPVPGWTAEPVRDSFTVIRCPEFAPKEPKKARA